MRGVTDAGVEGQGIGGGGLTRLCLLQFRATTAQMTWFLAVAAKSWAVGFVARDFRLQFLDSGLPGGDCAP